MLSASEWRLVVDTKNHLFTYCVEGLLHEQSLVWPLWLVVNILSFSWLEIQEFHGSLWVSARFLPYFSTSHAGFSGSALGIHRKALLKPNVHYADTQSPNPKPLTPTASTLYFSSHKSDKLVKARGVDTDFNQRGAVLLRSCTVTSTYHSLGA